ncbi:MULTISPECIES: ATP-grasp domain-containing protein [Streptomyces]|uniref:ATP-grasp domain-containing protein n=2 Tax=Streptomyces fradiae TaxID=1906 RepID=A0ABQ6XNI0_STRFR|nr:MULTISPECIES: ATP-grasp domain-containing protein [Streptomyces]KAF0647323.1 hypothetical protein K701_24225 [Streptomyces fradiae ATCC 10745 = DSM 40063]
MQSDDRPILIVGYTAGWKSVAARHHGHGTTVFLDTPGAAREKNLAEVLAGAEAACELVEIEYEDPDAASRFHREYRGRPPAAVIPGIEYAVPFAARLAELYGLPGAGPHAADRLRDKWLLRQAVAGSGVRGPLSRPVEHPDDVRRLMALTGTAVVLKPANRQGSIGTRIVRAPEQVDEAWRECVLAEHDAMAAQSAVPARMLAETFLEGPEYSVELLVRDGGAFFRNVTAKSLFPGDRPVELGHVVPGAPDPAVEELLYSATETLLRTVGFGTGFVHCEWILVDGVPHLVECAGRMPGGGIIDLIESAWDFDIVREYLRLMRGQEPTAELPARPSAGACTWFVTAEPGRVERVDGVAEAADRLGVLAVHLLVGPGPVVRAPRSGRDRVGYVMAGGSTGETARQRAQAAARSIRVVVAPPQPPSSPPASAPAPAPASASTSSSPPTPASSPTPAPTSPPPPPPSL